MELIDSHCHLEEIENLSAAIARARAVGLIAIVAVGSDSTSNQKVLKIADEYQGFVYPASGLHPGNLNASTNIGEELEFIEEHIAEVKAIGEIGLDYHKKVLDNAPKDVQKSVLRDVLSIAGQHKKPVIIHSRYAWRDALTLTEEAGIERAVFHWFTGPSSVLKDIIDLGYYISATPAAEYHQEHRRAIKAVPIEKLLLETDSPVSYGMEVRWRAEPADTLRTLKAAAEAREFNEVELARITTDNAIKFFDLRLR